MAITLPQLLWSGEECHCYVGAHRVADKEGSGSLVEEAEEELFTFFNEWIFPIIQVGYLDGGKVLFFVLLFISGHEGLRQEGVQSGGTEPNRFPRARHLNGSVAYIKPVL